MIGNNAPIHSHVHLGIVAIVIIIGLISIVIAERKKKRLFIWSIFILYAGAYIFLTFLYRKPMKDPHIRLELFWSYKEAFDGISIRRLGVARSILLNIFLFIPLGYLLPAVIKYHQPVICILLIILFSILTETIQLLCKVGLCETDDVINNTLGGIIGLVLYTKINQFLNKIYN